jgi:hypothetical protein
MTIEITGRVSYPMGVRVDELNNGQWTTQINARNIFGSYEEIVSAVVNADIDRARSFAAELIDPSMRGLVQDQRDIRRALGWTE